MTTLSDPETIALQQIATDLESAFLCQWFRELISEPGSECDKEGTWLVKFRSKCTHGFVLIPKEILLCDYHVMMLGGGYLQCGCECIIVKPTHIVESWRRIK